MYGLGTATAPIVGAVAGYNGAVAGCNGYNGAVAVHNGPLAGGLGPSMGAGVPGVNSGFNHGMLGSTMTSRLGVGAGQSGESGGRVSRAGGGGGGGGGVIGDMLRGTGRGLALPSNLMQVWAPVCQAPLSM